MLNLLLQRSQNQNIKLSKAIVLSKNIAQRFEQESKNVRELYHKSISG